MVDPRRRYVGNGAGVCSGRLAGGRADRCFCEPGDELWCMGNALCLGVLPDKLRLFLDGVDDRGRV